MLDTRIAAARRGLVGPALLRALWPMGLWVAAYLIFWLTGLNAMLPAETQALASLVFYLGLAAGIWLGFRRWRRPSDNEARDLIDASVEGRPMSVWSDRPSKADPLAWKLWSAHKDRMAKLAVDAKGFKYGAYWKREDPAYLRIVVPALVIGAGVFALSNAPVRLLTGVAPDFGALVGANRLTVEAWVTPPIYTGEPPTVLTNGETYVAPEGSEITLRVSSPGAPTITIDPENKKHAELHPGPGIDKVYESRIVVDQPMTIKVHFWGSRASYNLNIKPDRLPKVEFVPKEVEENGKKLDKTIALGTGDRTEFGYKVSDDYGVTKMELGFRFAHPAKGAEDFIDLVPVQLNGFEPKEETGQVAQDLVRARLAGLDVMVRLRAYDASGRFSDSREIAYHLPEKIFLQPNARSAQEIRAKLLQEWRAYAPPAPDDRATLPRGSGIDAFDAAAASRLIKAPQGVKESVMMLEALTYQPEDYFVDPVIFLGLVHAKEIINVARSKEEAEYAEDVLWSVALRAEYGSLTDAEAALESARQALENALRNGASPEDIKRLMDMYEKAVEDYLAAKMADAIRNGKVTDGGNGPPPPPGQGGQPMNDDELQRKLDALRDLAAKGDKEAARQLLAEMQKQLESMKNMQLQISKGGQQGGQQQNGPMQRALNRALQETNKSLNNQRDLNDQTDQAQKQGAGRDKGQELAEQQRKLREDLERQMQSGGGQPPGQQQGQQQPGGQQPGQQGQQPGQQGQGQQGQGQQPGGQQPGQQGQGQQGQQPGQGQRPGQGQPGQQQGQNGQPGQQPGQGQRGGQGDQRGPITGPGGLPGSPNPNTPGQETGRSRQLMAQAIESARRAEDALRRGDFAGARAAQQELMGALQNRSSELARAANEIDPNAKNSERDPMGRLNNGDGGYGENVKVPEELDRERARDIRDKIRELLGDRTISKEERDYLNRLLNQFESRTPAGQ